MFVRERVVLPGIVIKRVWTRVKDGGTLQVMKAITRHINSRTLAHLALVIVLVFSGLGAATASACGTSGSCGSDGAEASCSCCEDVSGCCATEPAEESASSESTCCSTTEPEPPVAVSVASGCCSTENPAALAGVGCEMSAAGCPCHVSAPELPVAPARELNPTSVGKRAETKPLYALADLLPLDVAPIQGCPVLPDAPLSSAKPCLDKLCRYLC